MNMITESEELILNLLWRDEKLSVMQIVKALEAQKTGQSRPLYPF